MKQNNVCPECGHAYFWEITKIFSTQGGVRIFRDADGNVECDYDMCAELVCDYNDPAEYVSLKCMDCNTEFFWDKKTKQYDIPEQDASKQVELFGGDTGVDADFEREHKQKPWEKY